MIGIFDSGLGGLSVLAAIRKHMPRADIVYFGDTQNAPYGNKSAREIRELIAGALHRLAAEGATDIVSACNSASVSVCAAPLDVLKERECNLVEMVGPTVAALAPLGKNIALLGTNATVSSGIYQEAFKKKGVVVDAMAVPELAGLIERGVSSEEMLPVVRSAVLSAVSKDAEIISLSCTHYPFVKELFERCVRDANSTADVFDPAEAVAKEVAQRFFAGGDGVLRFLVSKESATFDAYAERLFADTPYTISVAGSIYEALKTP